MSVMKTSQSREYEGLDVGKRSITHLFQGSDSTRSIILGPPERDIMVGPLWDGKSRRWMAQLVSTGCAEGRHMDMRVSVVRSAVVC
jgi:hypothetical protein